MMLFILLAVVPHNDSSQLLSDNPLTHLPDRLCEVKHEQILEAHIYH